MPIWGDAYKEGFKKGVAVFITEDFDKFDEVMERLYKNKDGSPTQYAVAFKCCGGVDAHCVGCR